jgi:phage terminase large subunit-like protein
MAKPKFINDPATEYAIRVVGGGIVAGRLVHLACERHLRDLEDGPARGLKWDVEAANRAIDFFRKVLCLNGGGFEGKPFDPQPWQCFIIGSLFGWKIAATGYRRFRTSFGEIGKGNGKSPLAGGIGLYCLVADDEARAEVYACATKRDQAMILFRDAVAMVDQSPALHKRLEKSGAEGKVWNLAYHQTGSFFRAIGSDKDSQSGPRPHCALIDEVHEHKSPIIIDMMKKGTKNRRQALIFEITNSGVDRESVCWHHHAYSIKVLEGHQDDAWFAFICSLDPCEECRKAGLNQPKDGCAACDDWRDETKWVKTNPVLGSESTRDLQLRYLREQVHEAKGMPSAVSVVLRLNFCVWTETVCAAISMDLWDACGVVYAEDWRRQTIERLRGRPCKAGLDLGSFSDLTALGLLFREDDWTLPNGEVGEIYTLLPYFWVPEATARKRSESDKVDYQRWIREGWILPTGGNTTDYQKVRRDLRDLQQLFQLSEIAVDRLFQGIQLCTDLADDGFEVIAFGQGFYSMAAPTKRMLELIAAGKVRHGGNPVLRWMAGNAATEQDAAGSLKWSKKSSSDKIDGVVAVTMALGREDAAPVSTGGGMEMW